MLCAECNREFTPTMGLNTICSDECRLNRKNRRRRKPKVERACAFCGIIFLASDHQRKFCSRKCKRSFDTQHRQQFVEGRRAKRKEYKKNLPQVCEICGFDRAIQYCHIVGIAEGGETKEDNMVVLYPNHHWLFDNELLTKEEFDILLNAYNQRKKS